MTCTLPWTSAKRDLTHIDAHTQLRATCWAFSVGKYSENQHFSFWKGSGKTTGEEHTNRWWFSALLNSSVLSDRTATTSQKWSTSCVRHSLSSVSELKPLSQLHRNNLALQSLQLTIILELFKGQVCDNLHELNSSCNRRRQTTLSHTTPTPGHVIWTKGGGVNSQNRGGGYRYRKICVDYLGMNSPYRLHVNSNV